MELAALAALAARVALGALVDCVLRPLRIQMKVLGAKNRKFLVMSSLTPRCGHPPNLATEPHYGPVSFPNVK